jgi:hypothetical protein
MMSENFIYCLEKVPDAEIEQKTEVLISLEKLALKKEITSIYKACDSIEGLEESIIELTKNDDNFKNYHIIYFVLRGEENIIIVNDYTYSLQEIAELFEGRMKGKILHFANTKTLDITNEEARYFLDVTGATAISGYGVELNGISSTNLDLDFFSLFYEFDDIIDVYNELNDTYSTLCELLDFKLYY